MPVIFTKRRAPTPAESFPCTTTRYGFAPAITLPSRDCGSGAGDLPRHAPGAGQRSRHHPPPSSGCSTFPCPLLSTVDRCRCRVELICPKARCTVLESSLESFVPACATLGSARARRAEAVSKPRLNDQSRILISPSWAADAMSRPSREYTAPRLKPRAPDADGLSCANRSHSSARKARWNHIA